MNQVIGESVDWNELTGGSIVDDDGLLFYTGTLLDVFGKRVGSESLEIVFDKTLDSNYLPEEMMHLLSILNYLLTGVILTASI